MGDEPQGRGVRLVSESAQVGDPVRVTVAGAEVEGRIEAVEASTLRVRIRRSPPSSSLAGHLLGFRVTPSNRLRPPSLGPFAAALAALLKELRSAFSRPHPQQR